MESSKKVSNTEVEKKPRRIFGLFTKIVWIVCLCTLLLVPLYVYTVSIDLFGLYGGMPSLKALENPENDMSSELISGDGELHRLPGTDACGGWKAHL